MDTVYMYKNDSYKTYLSTWDWFESLLMSIPIPLLFFEICVDVLNISFRNAAAMSLPIFFIVLICALMMSRARNMQIDFQKQISELKKRVDKLENAERENTEF